MNTASTQPRFSRPVTEIIRERFSCRSYSQEPIPADIRADLVGFLSSRQDGPFGTRSRFDLVAASEQDRSSLRGLGTYGFIRGATGFIVGAAIPQGLYLEDYGYLLEEIILYATGLGLGTCWLGGTFTKSSFARKIALREREEVPAVAAVGLIADPGKARNGFIRNVAGSHQRRPWERMFSDGQFGVPLTSEQAGDYAIPLEMVRLGPSASNRQPWQVVKAGDLWHFYLRRTEGYREGTFSQALKMSDLQRIDIGIAMCHFELAARELGLKGAWVIREPGIERPNKLYGYIASWHPRS
ncbi:MAG: nitroreductase family protein [Chloroflexota bacterium]